MKLLLSMALLVYSALSFSQELPGESPYIKNFRRLCQTNPEFKCSNDGLNQIKVKFTDDMENRTFYVTHVDIQKSLKFMSEQETKKAASGGPSAGEQAIDYIKEMEFQRNTVVMLQYSCVSLAGGCAYLAGKYGTVNKWLTLTYVACLASGSACAAYGNDSTKRYDEEIKQIKEACKDGASPEDCIARVKKGKKADLLPADNPSPSLGKLGTGDGAGDGGIYYMSPDVYVTPELLCVKNTIEMEGGPLGQLIQVPETTCYVR